MTIGVRSGVVAGCALLPVAFSIVYGYETADLSGLSAPWLWSVTPIVAALATETAVRMWGWARWLGATLLLPGVAAAGLWWWWLYSLLVWGNASTLHRYGLPTLVVGTFVTAALVAGRAQARKLGRGSRAGAEVEHVRR